MDDCEKIKKTNDQQNGAKIHQYLSITSKKKFLKFPQRPWNLESMF